MNQLIILVLLVLIFLTFVVVGFHLAYSGNTSESVGILIAVIGVMGIIVTVIFLLSYILSI